MMRRPAQTLTLALATVVAGPALAEDGPSAAPTSAEATQPDCVAGICQVRMTPQQLLAHAEALVRARRFGEARPLIEALSQAPATRFQSRFLEGYAAAEQGNHAHATTIFKNMLADDPGQVRVRLELARSMLALGQMGSADRQFRIAQQSGDLPPDIAQAIRGARSVIRSRRAWRFDVDVGLAPDSNINNATVADTVNIQLGDLQLPVALNGDAQAKSGLGQVASVNAGEVLV